MKKFIIAPIVALLFVLGLMAPAHAVSNTKQCNVPDGTPPVAIRIQVDLRDNGDRYYVKLNATDSGNRNWNWKLFYDGMLADSSSAPKGSFEANTTVINLGGGPVTHRFNLKNDSGTIVCNVSVTA